MYKALPTTLFSVGVVAKRRSLKKFYFLDKYDVKEKPGLQ